MQNAGEKSIYKLEGQALKYFWFTNGGKKLIKTMKEASFMVKRPILLNGLPIHIRDTGTINEGSQDIQTCHTLNLIMY